MDFITYLLPSYEMSSEENYVVVAKIFRERYFIELRLIGAMLV